MCADPKMLRLLAAELKEELAARKAVRRSGTQRRVPGVTWGMIAPAVCLVAALIVLTY